jgi:putative transcription factor
MLKNCPGEATLLTKATGSEWRLVACNGTKSIFIYVTDRVRNKRELTMPSCELCGRNMKGHGRNVVIEGARLQVCPQCAEKFGGQASEPTGRSRYDQPSRPSWVGGSTDTRSMSEKPRNIPRTPVSPTRKPKPFPKVSGPLLDDMVLIENYAETIRKARQKKGISQDELAQKIGERVSTLQSIEAGRLKPVGKTIRGLERELDISLLEPIGTVPLKIASDRGGSGGPTLGDIVKVKKKKSQKSE